MKFLLSILSTTLLCATIVSAGPGGNGGKQDACASIGNGGNAVTIDGSFNDWSDSDFLGEMHEAGKTTKEVGAYAYAKYDCTSNLLCVHVKAAIEYLDNEFWVKSGSSTAAMKPTSDGLQTATDGTGGIIGWEACYDVSGSTVSNVEIHSNYIKSNGQGGNTASTGKSGQGEGICLSWDCSNPPPAPEPEPEPLPLVEPGCGSDDECMPENPDSCTVYKCNAGTCESAPAVDETPCGSGMADGLCYLGDHCMAGSCVPKYEDVTHVCRPSVGGCDLEETCSPDGTCPEDQHKGDMSLCGEAHDDMPCQKHDVCIAGECIAQYEDSTFTCGNTDSDGCMIPATCTGSSGECPADTDVPNGEICGPEQPDICRAQNQCNNGKCEAVYMPSTFVCRPADGPCDVDDHCSGYSEGCGVDEKKPEDTPCGAQADGICHLGGACKAGQCVDQFEPTTKLCREATCDCDMPEYCMSDGTCPEDSKMPNGSTCGDPIDDVCQGQSTCNNGQCEENFMDSSTVCRPSAGPCDVVDYCSGMSAGCGSDEKLPDYTTCGTNEDLSLCQHADHCMAGECVEKPAPATTMCREADGDCTEPAFCNGLTIGCPENPNKPDGITCGPMIDDLCQDQSQCSSGSCEPVFKPSTTMCRPAAGPCDVDDMCSGNSAGCEDKKQPTTHTCRESIDAGCDPSEQCDGMNNECPEDSLVADFELCGNDHDAPCQGHDHCMSGICSPNFMPADHMCRGSMDSECDPAEYCTGESKDCPINLYEPDGKTCGAAHDGVMQVCQSHDTCSNGLCVVNYVTAGTECRASSGPCDEPEHCTGDSDLCPEDKLVSADSMTVCRAASNSNDCDVAEYCNGSSPDCPADYIQPKEFSFKCGTVNYLCGDDLDANGGGTCNDGRNVENVVLDPTGAECQAFLDAYDEHKAFNLNIYNWKCPNGNGVSHYTLYDCHGLVGYKYEADSCGTGGSVSACDPNELIEVQISCMRRNLRNAFGLW